MPILRQETTEHVKNTMKESILILLYEMLGTAMMSILITNYYSMR